MLILTEGLFFGQTWKKIRWVWQLFRTCLMMKISVERTKCTQYLNRPSADHEGVSSYILWFQFQQIKIPCNVFTFFLKKMTELSSRSSANICWRNLAINSWEDRTNALHLPTRGPRVGDRGCFSISWVGSWLFLGIHCKARVGSGRRRRRVAKNS